MERNVTLDFVRGVAILGILLLNISAFGLPKAAYLNPAWYGAITPQDAWTWAFLDLIGQVKFLTLFALLFGAGLQMLLPRGRRWIQSRLTLLVLLGFIHGLLFWDGDILLAYGLVGLICWRLVRDAPCGKKACFKYRRHALSGGAWRFAVIGADFRQPDQPRLDAGCIGYFV